MSQTPCTSWRLRLSSYHAPSIRLQAMSAASQIQTLPDLFERNTYCFGCMPRSQSCSSGSCNKEGCFQLCRKSKMLWHALLNRHLVSSFGAYQLHQSRIFTFPQSIKQVSFGVFVLFLDMAQLLRIQQKRELWISWIWVTTRQKVPFTTRFGAQEARSLGSSHQPIWPRTLQTEIDYSPGPTRPHSAYT